MPREAEAVVCCCMGQGPPLCFKYRVLSCKMTEWFQKCILLYLKMWNCEKPSVIAIHFELDCVQKNPWTDGSMNWRRNDWNLYQSELLLKPIISAYQSSWLAAYHWLPSIKNRHQPILQMVQRELLCLLKHRNPSLNDPSTHIDSEPKLEQNISHACNAPPDTPTLVQRMMIFLTFFEISNYTSIHT